jgi:hypothetical protein
MQQSRQPFQLHHGLHAKDPLFFFAALIPAADVALYPILSVLIQSSYCIASSL